MTGPKNDLTTLNEPLRCRRICGPAFVLQGTQNGAAHGAAHSVPGEWWTRVQYRVLVNLQELSSWTYVDQKGARSKDTLQCNGIGSFNW
jgi:hypothetical protein